MKTPPLDTGVLLDPEIATSGVDLPTGAAHLLVLDLGFFVELDLDPNDPASHDEKVVLRADDGSFAAVQTVRDDLSPGDEKTQLHFTGLRPDTTYSLFIDHGDGKEYAVFRAYPLELLLTRRAPGG
jgi:hypothetical protein